MVLTDDKAEAEIGWVIDLITAIRSVRAEMNITVHDSAGAGRRIQGNARPRRALGRVHQTAGARVGDFVGRDGAARFGADSSCAARWRRCR